LELQFKRLCLPTAPGVYTIGQATDTVKITSNTTFPNSNPNIDKFTFFIPGKLEIGASITVQIGAVANLYSLKEILM